MTFRAKPFLTGLKDTTPRFQNFKFLNFSVYTTLSVPKHPISIKNFVHCGALQSRRAISGLFSFFLYTLYKKTTRPNNIQNKLY